MDIALHDKLSTLNSYYLMDDKNSYLSITNLNTVCSIGISLMEKHLPPFWVGLMDGDGSIQVNHWRKKNLQYRMVIKLSNLESNVKMLMLIKQHFKGHVRISKNRQFVL